MNPQEEWGGEADWDYERLERLTKVVQDALFKARWLDAYGPDRVIPTDRALSVAVVKALNESEDLK
jgi:hypothetical protein